MRAKSERHVNILMIDDNPADIELVRESFEDQAVAATLYSARGSNQAMAILKGASPAQPAMPDLILLDLKMPGMNGFDFLQELRRDGALQSIPVVILTSSSSQEDINRSYQLHANAYVVKPTGLDQFAQFVQSIRSFWLETARLPSPQTGKDVY